MRIVTALYIPADLSTEASIVRVQSSLAGLQKAIGGDIENGGDGSDWHCYVDEMGQSRGMPVNLRATMLRRQLGWLVQAYAYGPALFLGDDEDGREANVPDSVLSAAYLAFFLEEPEPELVGALPVVVAEVEAREYKLGTANLTRNPE